MIYFDIFFSHFVSIFYLNSLMVFVSDVLGKASQYWLVIFSFGKGYYIYSLLGKATIKLVCYILFWGKLINTGLLHSLLGMAS